MLSFLFTVLSVVVIVYLAVQVIRARYRPRPTFDEIHYTTTPDGWRLALHRYRARGEKPRGEPVMLHHGLTANHCGFDLGVGTPAAPVPSLAHWLAEQGFDVWVIELRGRGHSELAGVWREKNWTWTADDYINYDNPALIDYILSQSRFKQLHWIGHSMGGILLLAHVALHGSPKVASGITVASSLDYRDTGSAYQPLMAIRDLAGRLGRMPAGFFSTLMAPLTGRGIPGIEGFNYHPPNIAPAAARALSSGVIQDTSAREMHQLGTLFVPGGFSSADGKTHFAETVGEATTPLLLVAGDADQQATPATVDKTWAMLPGEPHAKAYFGKSFGHNASYGHFDLVAGLQADREVYPVLLDWLKKHRAKRG
jgi:pimeloyl-ACP methyl ester carboxylesterase